MAVVLRLVVDRRGRMIHGEIIDLGNRVRSRFLNWPDLVRALRVYVVSLAQTDDPATGPHESA